MINGATTSVYHLIEYHRSFLKQRSTTWSAGVTELCTRLSRRSCLSRVVLCCCTHTPWLDRCSWLPDQSGSHPNMLSAHFTRFLPDDLFVPATSEHSQHALENDPCSPLRCQDARWFTQPYACLSPNARAICGRSDAHPYVSVCDSARVLRGTCLCTSAFFL